MRRAEKFFGDLSRLLVASVAFGYLSAQTVAPGGALRATAAAPFDVPPELRPQVNFWQDAFTVYSKDHVAVHDTEQLDRVYSVLDFTGLRDRGLGAAGIERHKEQAKAAELNRVRAILRRFHQGERPRTEEDARIRALFDDDGSPNRFLRAADQDRIRTQTGLREKFASGISVGHRYFPEMEAIFRQEGVPVEITRLPLVESSFDLRAYSKVGAAGIWQFMPATARNYSLGINEAVDERLDPIAATRAAARYLSQSYRSLGTWPLAIMSYNHGPGGIRRAVRSVGTSDESVIIQRYRGPAFGFASRNFYPEFLAALLAEGSYVDHYGPLPLHQPFRSDFVELPHYVPAKSVLACANTSRENFSELNPSLLKQVYEGKQRIPRGYRLQLPAASAPRFEACYARLPSGEKLSHQRPQFIMHRVSRGQTLAQIARRYRKSVDEIRRQNGLSNKNLIRIGQVLRIPTG